MLYSFGDLVSNTDHVKDDEDSDSRLGFYNSWESFNLECSTGMISSLDICVTLHMDMNKILSYTYSALLGSVQFYM